ncbi:MAG: hypothetical protein IJ129_02915 [Ruminococcus sp.]|nr:hypothetical protein [Ruminococcus sp.]
MEYSDNSFHNMQQEAIRRVLDMQRRSKALADSDEADSHKASPQKPLFSLAGIDIDEEKALIAMLIYILYKQGADIKLLLGLGYLLL